MKRRAGLKYMSPSKAVVVASRREKRRLLTFIFFNGDDDKAKVKGGDIL